MRALLVILMLAWILGGVMMGFGFVLGIGWLRVLSIAYFVVTGTIMSALIRRAGGSS